MDLKEDVVNAPITAGQELGTLTITYNDQVCAQVPLLAQADVSASRFLVAKAAVEAFFAKTWVKLALVAIVVLVIVFVLWLKLGRRSSCSAWGRGGPPAPAGMAAGAASAASNGPIGAAAAGE
ncbi:d-alanyl-D-alanine carboxypeptidase [Oscillibacter sp. CAG:241]|nr:d-alanyl-D-alanine carboxypeptidase [Oscillibacter sp. CAG:241]